MSSEDHFNWPAAGRAETMYLATIKDEPAGFTRKQFFTANSPNLNITDIEKARPTYQGYQFTKKEVFANRNDDIEGSRPKRLHQPLEKVHYDLRNEDIHGTKPQSHKFVTTRKATNPLNPEYKLPHAEIRVATPPKFIRDNIDIKDIDGARPNPYTRYNIQRKTNNVEDIDGAKPKKEWLPQGKHSSLDVKDINSFWEFHTKRQTDPLSPRYKVVDEFNTLYEYGKLDNKVMARHPKEVNKVTSSDLKTDDILGAQAGTSTQHLTKIATRDDYMKTTDIPGAQVATLKKGMTTTRQVNPIWPVYTIPGHSEPEPIYTKNLRSPAVTKYGGTASASGFNVKSEIVSPATQTVQNAQPSRKSQDLNIETGIGKDIFAQSAIERKPSGGDAKERRISSDKTPSSQGSHSRGVLGKVTSPLMRTGEEVLYGDRNNTFSKNSEYVPARMASKEDIAALENFKQQKSGPSRFNLETKKALNSSETYQNNVKNFFGLPSAEETNWTKSSVAEKFDKYISK